MQAVRRTIWMNVTTSAGWRRPAVGIVRTELQLAAELSALLGGDAVRLCVWRDGGFAPHSGLIEPGAREQREALSPSDYSRAGGRRQPPPALDRPAALRQLCHVVYSLLPGWLRQVSWQLAQRLRTRFQRPVAREQRLESNAAGKPIVQLPRIRRRLTSPFQPGDVLLSVGLDWEHAWPGHLEELRAQGVRVVTFCHDLIPVLFPQYCIEDVSARFIRYFLALGQGSDAILCNSRQSERDLLQLLASHEVAAPPTHVVALGDSLPTATGLVSPQVDALCAGRFILFVSTLDRRKNHQVLYQAYHLLCEQGQREQLPQLVFVGMLGGGMGELMTDIALDPLTRGLIVHLERATDAELSRLYTHALFCVYPSLYEGWGLPVAEALAMGKPVLCSDRASLPEVGGDLVCYLDPWSPREWAAAILKMAEDDDYREQWVERICRRYQPRSWQQTAAAIAAVVESLPDSAAAGTIGAGRQPGPNEVRLGMAEHGIGGSAR